MRSLLLAALACLLVTGAAADGINNPQTNASALTSGTVASARGGAGTINGALKANGSGVVSQAACADLSNAAASCATDATNASNISSGTLAATRGGASPAGQLPATATNDSASAGNVGEFITNTGTAVSVTSTVAADITSVSLTAGDWDCRGVLGTNPAAGTTQSDNKGWMSTTSATQPTFPAGGLVDMDVSVAATSPIDYTTGVVRFSLSTTTTVFLSWLGSFATSTETVTAKLDCRRVR